MVAIIADVNMLNLPWSPSTIFSESTLKSATNIWNAHYLLKRHPQTA